MSANTNKGATGPGRGLGRGFGSLLPQDFDQSMLLDKHDRVQKLSLDQIKTDPNQPRKYFDKESLEELAVSIKRYGILQPLVVTQKDDTYYIVAGERRFRAAGIAKLATIPVLVRSLEELDRLEISLVENVQRVDLNPIEQAVSLARLHEQFNFDYAEIGKRLGKGPSTIANTVRLLQLPEFARDAVAAGKLSEGHARAVLPLKEEKLQKQLVEGIIKEGWSVRRAEQFAMQNKVEKDFTPISGLPRAPKPTTGPEFDKQLGTKLSAKWGLQAGLTTRARGGGKLQFDFKSQKQLDAFLEFLRKNS